MARRLDVEVRGEVEMGWVTIGDRAPTWWFPICVC
jgi:hypothetical protein